jgi:hypothetical protein
MAEMAWQIGGRGMSSKYCPPADINPEWKPIYDRIHNGVGKLSAFSWIRDIRFVGIQETAKGKKIVLRTWSIFTRDMIRQRFRDEICHAANVDFLEIHDGGPMPIQLEGRLVA